MNDNGERANDGADIFFFIETADGQEDRVVGQSVFFSDELLIVVRVKPLEIYAVGNNGDGLRKSVLREKEGGGAGRRGDCV